MSTTSGMVDEVAASTRGLAKVAARKLGLEKSIDLIRRVGHLSAILGWSVVYGAVPR